MEQRITVKKRLLMILIGIVVGMFGFAYALVPLYNVLCKQLGINGKTAGAVVYDEKKGYVDLSRMVSLDFVATNNEDMPWEFHPMTRKLRFHPGETERVAFFARNDTDHTMIVQAIPSVTPGLAANYLKKTECFCFTQQTLKSHEQMEMPIVFHIDPALPKEIKTITLSYTLFDVTDRLLKKN